MSIAKELVKKTFIISLFITVTSLNYSCASSKSHLQKFDNDPMKAESNISTETSQNNEGEDTDFDEFPDDIFDEEISESKHTINDPLEPFNRAMFKFNDKFYYWVLKPVAKGYHNSIHKNGRIAVRRFFSNIASPGRFVNCILQFKLKSAGVELGRFVINSTVGIAGFLDPAQKLNLYKQDEDFGQTLGYYGVGHGFYLNLPFLGPLTLRDTVGLVGNIYLDPITYLPFVDPRGEFAIRTYRFVNETSLNITLYDDIVKTAFDPYIFMKNAYYQIRESKIKE